nr:winged helix-turn-helix transcriptional regulator [Carboxylicivirga mesophila]
MEKSYCPIDTFINAVKGKRKGTIILHLSQGHKRYTELVRLLTDISERMLSKQLKNWRKMD